MNSDEIRDNYLIEWRQGLWAQIRQKEDAIWRFISFYASAITLVTGIVVGTSTSGRVIITLSGSSLMVLTLLIVTFWGLIIVLDANYWLQRNLLFVGNIEREILFESDIGKLIPKSYTRLMQFSYASSYKAHLHILFLIIFLAVCVYANFAFSQHKTVGFNELVSVGLVAVIFCLALLYVLYRDRSWLKGFLAVRTEAPGKDPPPQEYPEAFEVTRFHCSSLVSGWGSFLIIMGCGTFLVLATKMIPCLNSLKNLTPMVLGILVALGIIRIIIHYFIRRQSLKCEENLSKLQDMEKIENKKCIDQLVNASHYMTLVENGVLMITVTVWSLFMIYYLENQIITL